MLATVRALMEHLIDYAGMFPPARLPLREALRHYTHVAATPEAWMLGRFVCQAAKLGELRAAIDTDGAPASLVIAALGRGGRDVNEFADNADADLRAIEEFRTGPGAPATVDVIELPLPAESPSRPRGPVQQVLARFTGAGLNVFCEIPHGPGWMQHLTIISQNLVGWDERVHFGLKIRCGGATVAAIPTPQELAAFIACCESYRLPWKATAGLHHPLRRRDPASGAMMHGFLNVFAAGIFVHAIQEPQITALLEEEAIDAFHFAEDCLRWRDWECTAEQIRAARRWAPSFGSCSFDEPRDDLRRLGLIP